MWKSTVGHDKVAANAGGDDDWDTDADFVNNVSEKEQRWGSKSVEGSGKPAQAVDLHQLRNKVTTQHDEVAKKEYNAKPGFSHGYGGKFGVQTDRMDKSAVGFDAMTGPSATHSSIPKYEKPVIASKPTDFKKKFEQAPDTTNSVEEARKARAEKDRLDRERIKKEEDAKRSKELEHSKREEEQRRARQAEEDSARAEAEAEARARARAQAEEEEAAAAQQAAAAEPEVFQAANESYPEAQAEADAQYSEYVSQEAATAFEGGFTATAMYEYEAGGDDELGFGEGELIINIEVIDDGWWRGECNGRYGLFPANYVQANN